MDKSEGSGVCDFQDKDCGDGFSKKEEDDKKESKKEETKQKSGNSLTQESSNKKYVKIDAGMTGASTGVPILDSVAANDL